MRKNAKNLKIYKNLHENVKKIIDFRFFSRNTSRLLRVWPVFCGNSVSNGPPPRKKGKSAHYWTLFELIGLLAIALEMANFKRVFSGFFARKLEKTCILIENIRCFAKKKAEL